MTSRRAIYLLFSLSETIKAMDDGLVYVLEARIHRQLLLVAEVSTEGRQLLR